jgi:hypothetical protein
MLARGVKLNL